jgi:superfamily II DNA or RNA helicase
MNLIQPYFLYKIKAYIDKGYTLDNILDEYNNPIVGEFDDYIKANYYHLNNGPDLRDYQKEAIIEAKKLFNETELTNYKLFWCCGLGKTKTALTISKQLNFKTILISLPSVLLLHQFAEELEYFYPLTKPFKYYSNAINEDLTTYLSSTNRYKIVLTTYHSSKHILNSVKLLNFVFDFVILDEAHHLHSKDSKSYSYVLSIPYKKRLLLTATPNIGEDTEHQFSLENSDIFKGLSNTKSVSWAIDRGFITNYNIIVLNINNDDLNLDIFNWCDNKDLLLAAYMALKCIYNNKSKKIIIYCNKVDSAKQIQEIINVLISKYSDDISLFNNNNLLLDIGNYELNGTDSCDKRKKILALFTNAEYGIMNSVQLFGEGYDYPGLDTVLFAEKMDSSIRIVQSALRPCRKDSNNLGKKANILLPVIDNNYTKLKQILLKLKSVDTIINKIEIYNNKSFKPSTPNMSQPYNKFELDYDNKKLLETIELEYLHDITHNKILDTNFTNSKVISCRIKKNTMTISTKTKYRQIMIDIWKTINRDDLIHESTFTFKSMHEVGVKGYNWCEDIEMSFQSKNSNGSMREIIHIIQVFKYSLEMSIMLANKETYNININ